MSQTGLVPVREAPACSNLDYSSLVVQLTKTRRNTNSMRRGKILRMITLSTSKKGLISKITPRKLVPRLHLVWPKRRSQRGVENHSRPKTKTNFKSLRKK